MVSRFDDRAAAIAGGVPAELSDFFYPNIWPQIDGFRTAVSELFTITNALAGRLMGLVAAALGLDASWFDPMLEPNASTFAVNHYPPREDEDGTDEPSLLFSEHVDGNSPSVSRGPGLGSQSWTTRSSSTWVS